MEHSKQSASESALSKIEYADRTSTVASLYPGFESWNGSVQVWRTRSAWFGAGEPWVPPKIKADLTQEFFESCHAHGVTGGLLPISEELAVQLKRHGYGVLPIGCEAIFDLADYFEDKEPVLQVPTARTWWRKGAKIAEMRLAELDEATRARWSSWADERRESRSSRSLSFLNQVRPWEFSEWKRYFVLRHQGRELAWLSVAKIPAKNAYFLIDYFRSPEVPATGTLELAIVETLRALHRENVQEVRWGLVPFYWPEKILKGGLRNSLSRLARLNWPVSFEGVARFKSKFKPTRWEEQYAASSKSRIGPAFLLGVARAHYPTLDRPPGQLVARTLAKISGTLSAVVGMALLFLSGLQNAGYTVAQWTWGGWLAGPLFHRHAWHAFGDLLSVALIGGTIEFIWGKRLWFATLALGFWATNPLTDGMLKVFLPIFRPDGMPRFLTEADIGSSNAAYAFAGFWAARTKRPAIILMPFLINALLVNVAKESWLALHHFTGLALGYAVSAWAARRK